MSQSLISSAAVSEWVRNLTNGKEITKQPVQAGMILVGYTPNSSGMTQVATAQISFPSWSWQPVGQLTSRPNTAHRSTEWLLSAPPLTPSLFRVERYNRRPNQTSSRRREAYVLAIPDDIVLCEGEIGSEAQMQACTYELQQQGLGPHQASQLIAVTGTRFATEAVRVATAASAMTGSQAGAVSYLSRLVNAKLRDKRNAFDLMDFTPSSSTGDDLKIIIRGALKFAELAWGIQS